MIKYINQAGMEIMINENPTNIKAAESAGWTKAKKAAKKAKKVVDNGDS